MADHQLYLGQPVDPSSLRPVDGYALLGSEKLVRHAVCLGMTGSGKTGLCVALLEEVAMGRVPIVVIDPKGDMGNLVLGFPEHRPEDFLPWVDPAEAAREGISTEQLAARLAERWREGLAKSAVDGRRVRAFTDRARVTLYTPGSEAGVPVDILGAFAPPAPGVLAEAEALADLIDGAVRSLLALVGVQVESTDPPAVVIGAILEAAWRAGQTLELHDLIVQIADPPFGKVGVFPVDQFWPRADRMKLATRLNGVLAAPSFQAWTQGPPLDPERLFARDGETAPVSVFSLAHLSDDERMFFISTLLSRIVAWSRAQPGTSSLRALVYFDEVFGYLPPYPKNPPTKGPVLTLLKQARAVGVGTMLVTQNPVDVDYKALSNAGTWFVGRLQTQQDRERVLDGLGGAGAGVDKATVGAWLEQLPSRTFVVKDAGEPAPSLLRSRWAICYLRGPLTRAEIAKLPKPPFTERARPAAAGTSAASGAGLATPPPAPAGFTYRFLSPEVAFSARLAPTFERGSEPRRADGRTRWAPALYARLHLVFEGSGDFRLARDEHRLWFPLGGGALGTHSEPPFEDADWLAAAPQGGLFEPLPASIDEAKELKALEKQVVEEVFRGETEQLFRNTALKLDSRAGEPEATFRDRCQQAAQARADAEIAKLRDKVEAQAKRLEDRRLRKEDEIARAQGQARAKMASEAASGVEMLFGLFMGRKRSVASAVGRRMASSNASSRVGQLEDELERIGEEIQQLQAETAAEIGRIQQESFALVGRVEASPVRLKKANVRLDSFGIVWVPVTRAV